MNKNPRNPKLETRNSLPVIFILDSITFLLYFTLFAPNLRKMILKVFKIVWFVSLLVMTGVFVYCYASWPQLVNLSEPEGTLTLDKGMLFYSCLALAALFNALVFVVSRLRYSEAFSTWFYGLVSVFHAFMVSGLIFITIYNSLEKYDYANVGPTLYASIVLLVLWSFAWPAYLVYSRFSTQPKVG